MLLIHGLTGDENSMWIFARNLSAEYWMIAPRAPHASQMAQGGYSWRPPAGEAEDHQPPNSSVLLQALIPHG
jgi:hypothetical protein